MRSPVGWLLGVLAVFQVSALQAQREALVETPQTPTEEVSAEEIWTVAKEEQSLAQLVSWCSRLLELDVQFDPEKLSVPVRLRVMRSMTGREIWELTNLALTADIFFGPAHNNLGAIHLGRGDLYEAANEFERSRKLMPGHPDPRFNLAMTLEQAGQVDEALASYSAALEVYDGFLPAIQGLALLTLKSGREDKRMNKWLKAIALRSENEQWRDWAIRHLSASN